MTEIRDRWVTPGPQPNGLQASSGGLWVIDQVDNALYKLDYGDGSVIARLPTETEHSSGVTEGGGFLWVASTYTLDLVKVDYEGRTVARYDTPGTGVIEATTDGPAPTAYSGWTTRACGSPCRPPAAYSSSTPAP